MRADKKKLEMAMARACMNRADLIIATAMPENTVKNVLYGKNVRPATLGRVAKTLGVDPTGLLAEGWDNAI